MDDDFDELIGAPVGKALQKRRGRPPKTAVATATPTTLAPATEPLSPIPEHLDAADLATLFGIHKRTVQQWASEGVLKRGAAGFDVRASIRAVVDRLQIGRAKSGDLTAERTRLAAMQADKVELQNATARGELIPAKEAASAWAATLIALRAAMLAIPGRVAPRLGLNAASLGDLDSEIRAALEDATHAAD